MPTPFLTHRQFWDDAGDATFGGAVRAGVGVEVPTEAAIVADALAAWDAAARQKGWRIPSATADLALGQVLGESNFGRRGTLGGNDWGAFQAGMTRGGRPAWIAGFAQKYAKGPPGVGGLAHRDSSPGGGSYVAYYRVYPSQAVAAEDWMSAMVPRLGLVTDPPADAQTYATRAYVTGYFEGIHAGARPVGQREEPFNDAEAANIADYASLIERNAATVAAVRASGKAGRDPTTIDFPSVRPLYDRLSAGLVAPGANAAAKAAAARKAFPKGGKTGDYDALVPTQGLAWIVGPPPGYRKDGTKGWGLGAKLFTAFAAVAASVGFVARR